MKMTQLSKRSVLNSDSLRKLVPSVFAEKPSLTVSNKYEFIPTIHVVSALEQHGLYPVEAIQSRSKTEDGKEFSKHMIRFTRGQSIGDSILDIILTNSHNGKSSFELSMGLWRQVCSNGLVVCNSLGDHERIKHVGNQVQNVIEATYRILEDSPKLQDAFENFSKIELTSEEQNVLAEAAHLIKFEGELNPIIKPNDLLTPRRWEDKKNSLWTTFNRIQENLIQGGLRGDRVNGRTRSTRKVSSINENLRINKALWQLTEKTADLKLAA